jgi:hypothetical protein
MILVRCNANHVVGHVESVIENAAVVTVSTAQTAGAVLTAPFSIGAVA